MTKNNINIRTMKRSVLKSVTFLALIMMVFSCKPSADKMELKLNRRIEKAKTKITKFETKITGYEQKIAMIHEQAVVVKNSAEDKEVEKKKKEIEKLAKKLEALQQEVGSVGEDEVQTASKIITTIQPKKKDFIKYLEVQGAVTSKENIMVSSNTGGVIMDIIVTEGQYVGVGQAIARINSETLQSSIAEVENALVLAQTVYEKQDRLWNELKIGTEIQYLQAKNNKENLEKKLETLRIQLGDATVRTTVAGVVDEIYANQGELAGPGSPIARVVNLNKVQVEAEIPESFIGKFKKGDKVQVYFQSLDVTRSAEIKAVSQTLNPGNRTFKIEIDLPNKDKVLKPYLLATVKLNEYENKDQIVVPTKLIQEGKSGSYVFTVNSENVVERKWVTVGQTYNGESEVIEGLDGTENIVNLGFRDIHEGQEIKVDNTSNN